MEKARVAGRSRHRQEPGSPRPMLSVQWHIEREWGSCLHRATRPTDRQTSRSWPRSLNSSTPKGPGVRLRDRTAVPSESAAAPMARKKPAAAKPQMGKREG
jgi:hypothetical protein